MRTRYVVSILAVIAVIGAVVVNSTTAVSMYTGEPIAKNTVVLADEETIDPDQLRERIPDTLEEAQAQILVRNRFLLWTHDGAHVMWGYYGKGVFVGTDNLGKRAWGIYGNNVFAGFYDGGFFWGRYRGGYWTAIDLFGLPRTHGEYRLFPTLQPLMTCDAAKPE